MDHDESEATEVLEEEIAEGRRLAHALAEHLRRMGAAATELRAEVDGQTYVVTVAVEGVTMPMAGRMERYTGSD